MTAEGVRVPTIEATVRKYVRTFFGERSSLRTLLPIVAVILVLPIVLPPIELGPTVPLASGALLILVGSLQAGYHAHRFGGSFRLVLAAAITTFAVGLLLLVAFVLVWISVGGRLNVRGPDGGPIVPGLVIITALLVMYALKVIAYFHFGPARGRAAAEFEREVRAERARRGAPPLHS